MLAPIVERMVHLFSILVGYIDIFAKKLGFAGVSFKNISKSAKGTAKATRQLVAGFDELNVYSSSSGGGGGGSYLIDPLKDFDPLSFEKVEEAFRQFGEKIKEILQKVFDWIANIQWFDLGQMVWDWVTAVDWSGIISNLSQLLGGIFGAVGAFIAGFFKDAWDGAVNWWRENAIKDGEFTMEGFLQGIWNVMKSIGQWIYDHIFAPFINGFKAVFKIGSPSKVMYDLGLDIVNGLFNGLNTLWNTVKQIFVNLVNGIRDLVSQGISRLTELINNFKTSVENVLTRVGSFLKTTSTEIINAVVKLFDSIKTKVSTFWDNLKSGASGAWEGIKSSFSNVTNWFKNTFSKAWEAVKAVFSTGGKVFDGIKEGIAEAFKKVVNALIKGINTVIAKPFNAINNMLNKIRATSVLGIKPFEKLWSYNPLSVPSIPYLAKGGIINSPTLAMVGEYAGAMANPEIVTPQNLLRDIIDEGNTELANVYIQIGRQIISAIENKDLEVSIGDDAIAKSAARGNQAYYMRTGQQLI